MLDLVRKRHDGDGWLVFTELANATGFGAKRYADALALGVWASTKYEAHLYEFKASREDLKKELRDQKKAEGVGQYCTYWWLTVTDESVIRDLVIPDCWGILIQTTRGGSRILKVHRKAPKLKPKPIGVMFAIAMIRNATKGWKSPADVSALQEEIHKLRHPPAESSEEEVDKDVRILQLEQRIKRVEQSCDAFMEQTGIDLRKEIDHPFGMKQMGRAFKLAQQLVDKERTLNNDVHYLSSAAKEFERRAEMIAETAITLRKFLGTEHTDICNRKSAWSGGCTCGLSPLSEVEKKLAGDAATAALSDPEEVCRAGHVELARDVVCSVCGFSWLGHDAEGGGVDRGDAGPPVQDAGVQLRDLGDQVPHG